MATLTKPHWYSLTAHRRWEDIVSMILGVIVLLSPLFISVSDNNWVMVSAGLTGVLIVALGALETVQLQRWEEGLEIVCGLWLAAAPFVLGYGGMERNLHVVIGLLVAALGVIELWQDRTRKLEG